MGKAKNSIQLIALLLCVLLGQRSIGQDITLEQEYELVRNWGALKYLDPQLSSGKVDMDSLFISKFRSQSHRLQVPDSLLAPHKNKTWYTTSGCKKQSPCFKNEIGYYTHWLDSVGYRVLLIGRYWNAVRYLSADRHSDASRWDSVLLQILSLERMVHTAPQFDTLLLQLAAQTHDPHAAVFGGSIGWASDHFFPPLSLTWIDSAYYVDTVFDSSYSTAIGKKVVAINSKPVDDITSFYLRFVSGQDRGYARRLIAWQYILPGDSGSILQLVFEGGGSLEISRDLSFERYHSQELGRQYAHSQRRIYNDSILYMDLSRPVSQSWLRHQLKSTKAAILDLRHYPDWSNYSTLSYFLDKNPAQCLSVGADLGNLMSDQITPQPKSTKAKRPVRLFILVSDGTISRAEYFAAILRTYHSGATVLGTHTVGAMGEMVCIPLYGDLSMSITCGEVTFDGVSYFKNGIAPDILVHRQPTDLLTGTDRILETAIDLAHGTRH